MKDPEETVSTSHHVVAVLKELVFVVCLPTAFQKETCDIDLSFMAKEFPNGSLFLTAKKSKESAQPTFLADDFCL